MGQILEAQLEAKNFPDYFVTWYHFSEIRIENFLSSMELEKNFSSFQKP